MINSLIAPGGFLIKEVRRGESMTNIDTLFEGPKGTLESIRRASAVENKGGNLHVVLGADHVQEVNGTFRMRLHSGGAAVGHARSYGPEWFKENAVKIWFGALNVPGGRGSNSDHDAMATIGLVCPAVAPGDGIWAAKVFRADTVQEIPLSEALQMVGAAAVHVHAGAERQRTRRDGSATTTPSLSDVIAMSGALPFDELRTDPDEFDPRHPFGSTSLGAPPVRGKAAKALELTRLQCQTPGCTKDRWEGHPFCTKTCAAL